VTDEERAALEAEWLRMTKVVLPTLAEARDWPVRADHCFQRILLDTVCGGVWYDHVPGRPAYRHLDAEWLLEAVRLARLAAGGRLDLAMLNRRSLQWRRSRPRRPPEP
jgi:hypothetical protein